MSKVIKYKEVNKVITEKAYSKTGILKVKNIIQRTDKLTKGRK